LAKSHVALFHAAKATIKKTAAHGIALVSVTDAWMSGRGAYVEMIAKHGLVAIHTASSSRLVAPRRHTAGARHQPDCDCGSLVARTDRTRYGYLSLHDDRGDATRTAWRVTPRSVAPGPGQGSNGGPTRRLAAVFGLALMMQALGLLAGSGSDAESDHGYLFVAFRPDLFGPADASSGR
jgi:hypothetical protein